MNLIQITEKITNGKNLIFYDKSVFDCYNELKDDYICIYFNEPTPVKVRLIKLINLVSDDKKLSLKRLTIPELKEILIKELNYERLVITFNHFDRLTKSTVQVKLFNENGKFSSVFHDSVDQIQRYADFAIKESDYLRRKKGLKFENPKSFLLLGYELNERQKHEIHRKERDSNIIVYTYNDLLKLGKGILDFYKRIIAEEDN